jgi:hypothetical protein
MFFSIAQVGRVAGLSGVDATFAFAPSLGGRLVDGTKISLNFPLGFFSASSSPSYRSSTLSRSTAAFVRDGLIHIQVAGIGEIAGNQTFCITLRGMVTGPATSGNETGISVLTSQVSGSCWCCT